MHPVSATPPFRSIHPAIKWASNPGFYRPAFAVAVIAGLFCFIVSATLIAQRIRASATSTWKSPEIDALKEKLRASPKEERLQEQIRNLDLHLRQRYFRRLFLSATGGYLLLGGAIMFLLSAKQAAQFHQKLPMPQPKSEATDQAKDVTAQMRWSVAATGGLIAITFLALDLAAPTTLPSRGSDLEKLSGGVPASSGATASNMPSPEEMQANWPRFRGADGSGLSIHTNLPLVWNPNTGDGILWKSVIALPGFSSPIVWKNRVFLAGGDPNRRAVFCFNVTNGELLWERTVEPAPGASPPSPESPLQAGFAAATIATDGQRVYGIFATGDLAAIDFEGKLVWEKNLGISKNAYGHASSLVLWQGSLLVQLDQGDAEERKSRLYAFEGATGRILWQRQRPVPSSWATPIVINAGGKSQIITLGVPWVIAYAANDGTELWRADCLNGEITPSPVFSGGLVLAVSPSEKLLAIRPDGQGNVTKTHVVWSAEDNVPDISSPVSNGELVFTVATQGVLTCYDIKDGKKHWEHDFEAEFQASPSIAGPRLYLVGVKGTVVVVEVNRQFKELARFEMRENIVACPAFANDRLYLRTAQHLYCIGAKEEKPSKNL